MTLPHISECKGPLYSCNFAYDPDYSGIQALIVMVFLVFFFFPICIAKVNIIIFGRIRKGVTISNFLCKKWKKKRKFLIKKRARYNFQGNYRTQNSLTNGQYGVVMNTQTSTRFFENIQLSKINQIAPIRHMQEDLPMITDDNDMGQMRLSRKKLMRKKGTILGRNNMSVEHSLVPRSSRSRDFEEEKDNVGDIDDNFFPLVNRKKRKGRKSRKDRIKRSGATLQIGQRGIKNLKDSNFRKRMNKFMSMRGIIGVLEVRSRSNLAEDSKQSRKNMMFNSSISTLPKNLRSPKKSKRNLKSDLKLPSMVDILNRAKYDGMSD